MSVGKLKLFSTGVRRINIPPVCNTVSMTRADVFSTTASERRLSSSRPINDAIKYVEVRALTPHTKVSATDERAV